MVQKTKPRKLYGIGKRMLRITIDLIPHGDEDEKKTISVLEIFNTGIKDIYDEYLYQFSGWWQDFDGSYRRVKDRVYFDRRKMIYFMVYKITRKICKPFGYIKE